MSRYKVVLAGCGSMANTWIDYTDQRNDVDIVGLVDVNLKTAKAFAEMRKADVPVFTKLREAIEQVQPDIVFDVTIPAAHKQVVTTALEAGCHVFGEKPMAESFEDAQSLVETAERTGKSYSVMQNRRYLKTIRALKELLSNNEIGETGSINADFFLAPRFGGFREEMASPLIMDMAIHTFDQARFITGADAVSVYCHEYNPPGSWYEGNASAVCIFEMSNGAVFTYRGSWSAIGMPTSWEAEWRITGSRGSACWDGSGLPAYEVMDETASEDFLVPVQKKESYPDWSGFEGHWGCLDEMFSAIEEKRRAETDCRDNIKSMQMVFAAMESAKLSKKIRL
ncbi:Gfo/Idh/MocA family oxidoreductase [Halobacillus salinarum]|uniref:Gfo/Idh/MocA family oxidoreductase n=1 Tax=Halobacillus salinarum TaxID=2932257 RepID=A0ABY4EKY1_9BACI|nr:Gfo/Idh/MocA family oxidoreductase [Halobacillus salinarum]UOQ45129.1 Gfo/Idh/MocA family oxidoreductase [Halobacillus salinarum]